LVRTSRWLLQEGRNFPAHGCETKREAIVVPAINIKGLEIFLSPFLFFQPYFKLLEIPWKQLSVIKTQERHVCFPPYHDRVFMHYSFFAMPDFLRLDIHRNILYKFKVLNWIGIIQVTVTFFLP
jgi:hypothetical protein